MARLAKEAFLETLWPTRCAVCDAPGEVLCGPCRQNLPYIDWWRACPRCGAPFGRVQCSECNAVMLQASGREAPPFAGAASAVAYQEGARRVVGAYKDQGERRLAETMATLMAPFVAPAWREGLQGRLLRPGNGGGVQEAGVRPCGADRARRGGGTRPSLHRRVPAPACVRPAKALAPRAHGQHAGGACPRFPEPRFPAACSWWTTCAPPDRRCSPRETRCATQAWRTSSASPSHARGRGTRGQPAGKTPRRGECPTRACGHRGACSPAAGAQRRAPGAPRRARSGARARRARACQPRATPRKARPRPWKCCAGWASTGTS